MYIKKHILENKASIFILSITLTLFCEKLDCDLCKMLGGEKKA